jgi:hypothetical protein
MPSVMRIGRLAVCGAGGMLVPEFLLDMNIGSSETTVERCVQCGDIIDRLILLNRARRPGF